MGDNTFNLILLVATCGIQFSECAVTPSQRQDLLDALNMYRRMGKAVKLDMVVIKNGGNQIKSYHIQDALLHGLLYNRCYLVDLFIMVTINIKVHDYYYFFVHFTQNFVY